jgi:hypothetical protein
MKSSTSRLLFAVGSLVRSLAARRSELPRICRPLARSVMALVLQLSRYALSVE